MSDVYISSSSLYTYPSFAKGIARIGDLFGTLDGYNYKETEADADVEALTRNWRIVGRDIANAIRSYARTTCTEKARK